jgi:cytochrome P450/NADPH-cytochrome P450 reductase
MHSALQAGTALGPAVLYFGCRSEQDFLYQQRLLNWQANGILTELQVAFSRQQGKEKVYVQDLIAASAKQLWPLLQERGAYVYVCGDARKMAPDVRVAFEGIAREVGGLGGGAAAEWMQDMRQQGRYLEDVWAN